MALKARTSRVWHSLRDYSTQQRPCCPIGWLTRWREFLALIAFLESGDPAPQNIEFVISPFLQKNFYIIGRLCFSEGLRIGLESGYPLTLRRSHPEAITWSTLVHRALFERLRDYTLMEYPPEHSHSASHENLRLAVLRRLKESQKF